MSSSMATAGSVTFARSCKVSPFSAMAMASAIEATKGTNIEIGAENIHWAEKGAFTGEISGAMLSECGVKYVIVGHSERRRLFGETDQDISRKLRAALDADLRPILCIGEDESCRALNIAQERISCQLKTALAEVESVGMRRVTVAYEPPWEDGTVSASYVGEMCAVIRGLLRKQYGARVARSTSVLYAGPADEAGMHDLLRQEDVDGGLIDDASLSPDRFLAIVQAANLE